MTEITIRPYEPSDRDAVRHICYVTGFKGEPIDFQWRDEASFADMHTRYYTDREPESITVADAGGEVKGYLLGCRDSSRAWSLESVIRPHLTRRGIAFRPGTAGFIWRAIADGITDAARGRSKPSDMEFSDPAYPAHLHINMLADIRGTGVGRRLIETWLDELRRSEIPGCHLQTMAENTNGIAFFEAMGFARHGDPVLIPGERSPEGGRVHVQTMVQRLG